MILRFPLATSYITDLVARPRVQTFRNLRATQVPRFHIAVIGRYPYATPEERADIWNQFLLFPRTYLTSSYFSADPRKPNKHTECLEDVLDEGQTWQLVRIQHC
jgi:hypothetical protein